MTTAARADDLPPGYVGWTVSPNQQYVIAIPSVAALGHSPAVRDEVLSADGRVLGEIEGVVGWDEKHKDLLTSPGRWSADSAYYLWRVQGKYGAASLVLLQMGGGRLVSQVDLLAEVRDEITRRTRAVNPRAFAEISQPVNGAPGFTLAVTITGYDEEPLTFPFPIHVELNSNPDEIVDAPNLRSSFDAEVDQDGKLGNINFHYGDN